MIRIPSTTLSANRRPGSRLLAVALGLAIAPWGGSQSVLAQTPLTRATITNVRNWVQLKPKTSKRRKAQQRDTLTPGDQLATGRASFAEFRFNEGTLARMGERAIFRFIPRSRKFILKEGTVLLLIPPGKGITQVRTPNVRTGIRGSALFIRHDENSNQTIVGALTDSGIEVSDLDGNASQVLKAGQMAVAVDGEVQGLYDFDLAKFFETSPLSEGILDGTVGTAEVLQEIQDGLEAQGNFATASAEGEIMQTPSFVKLGAENRTVSANSTSEANSLDRTIVDSVESVTAQDSTTFPGEALGIPVGSDATASQPIPPLPDPTVPEPGQPQPEPPLPGLELPDSKQPDLEIPSPATPAPNLPEPIPTRPEVPVVPDVPTPDPPAPEASTPDIPEPAIPATPEAPVIPDVSRPDTSIPESPTSETDDLTIPEREVITAEPEQPQLGVEEVTQVTEQPQTTENAFPGRGNGVQGVFPGQGNGVQEVFPGQGNSIER